MEETVSESAKLCIGSGRISAMGSDCEICGHAVEHGASGRLRAHRRDGSLAFPEFEKEGKPPEIPPVIVAVAIDEESVRELRKIVRREVKRALRDRKARHHHHKKGKSKKGHHRYSKVPTRTVDSSFEPSPESPATPK